MRGLPAVGNERTRTVRPEAVTPAPIDEAQSLPWAAEGTGFDGLGANG